MTILETYAYQARGIYHDGIAFEGYALVCEFSNREAIHPILKLSGVAEKHFLLRKNNPLGIFPDFRGDYTEFDDVFRGMRWVLERINSLEIIDIKADLADSFHGIEQPRSTIRRT